MELYCLRYTISVNHKRKSNALIRNFACLADLERHSAEVDMDVELIR